MKIKIAVSTCPNDTYIFAGMLTGQVQSAYEFEPFMDDVQVLNRLALSGGADVIKVSYGVVPDILDRYAVLKSGGALGFGCGPLVVAKADVPVGSLRKIAVPGFNTSAFRFFRMFYGDDFEFAELRFDMIMPAVLFGEVDAGVVIHEGRFVYQALGLHKLCDLGEMYEQKFNAPIPLGAIVISREIIAEADGMNDTIRRSIAFAGEHYDRVLPFMRQHAAEMDDDIMKKHVDLYVNKFTIDVTPAIPALCGFLNAYAGVFV
jgi:1,4-dihydroxy-6-naphthoate synthase